MSSERDEKQTCRRCGAPVDAEDRFCAACGSKVDAAQGLACKECRSALKPTAQFCPQCGARVGGGWGTGLGAFWQRARERAAGVDWTRAGRLALPAAVLLLAVLVGYAVGRGVGRPAPPDRVVSAARGWRGQSPASARPHRPSEPPRGAAARTPTATRASLIPGPPSKPASPPTRFRDFHITATSWELVNPPTLAADGDPYTAWHAWKTERFPQGDWLTLTFPAARLVTRIGLIPGRIGPHAREDGRVRSILVKAPGAPPQKLIFEDRPQLQYRDLARPVVTRSLILRIINVLPGTKSRHIIIPEVQVWGYPAPSQIAHRPME